MGTTAEKLQNIINAKADIGAAITEKGGTVPPKLIDYGKAIRALPAGGSPADELWGAPADPELVYKATRPADWMPMPEPGEREIYFLFEIPAGGSAAIALKSTTDDDSYTVSVGHMVSGAYVPKNTFTVAKGETWEADLAAADYPEFPVGDTLQVMIKMSFIASAGTCSIEKHPNNLGQDCNILEISADFGGDEKEGMLQKVGATTDPQSAQTKLKYVLLRNLYPGSSNQAQYFNGCISLVVVRRFSWARGISLTQAFTDCLSLVAYPAEDLVFSGQTSMQIRTTGNRMFFGCKSLAGIDFSKQKRFGNKYRMTAGCIALTRVKGYDISSCSNIGDAFLDCINLISIEDVVVGNAYTPTGNPRMANLPRLCKLTFAPRENEWTKPINLNISQCAFTRDGLVECFSSLPTITIARTISVYGNPGTADLTAADIAIATAKGWTVVTEEPAATAEEGS